MKQISLKKLKLTRFKGAHDVVIEFDPNETNIFGANGTGKTTIFDGFLWPLFDRDSSGQSDFNIKTLTEDGKPVGRVGHEVELTIDVDGAEIEIKRVYAEKWVKAKGFEEATFQGHENTFFWNGVPMKQVDFKKSVASEICDEYIFKLITSPLAFNALPWKERRELLTRIAGNVSDTDIAGDNKEYRDLVLKLAKYKSEEDYRSMLRASVEKSKKEIKLIPARIDEVKRSRPETLAFDRIRELIAEKQKEVARIDEQIEDSTKAYQAELDKINEHNRKIAAVKSEIEIIEIEAVRAAKKACEQDRTALNAAVSKLDACNREISSLGSSLWVTESEISTIEAKTASVDKDIVNLREKWTTVNAEECHDSTNCPTCKQALPDDQIEAIFDRFKANKAERLESINSLGKRLAVQKTDLTNQLVGLNERAADLEEKLKEKDAEYKTLESSVVKEKQALSDQDGQQWQDVYNEKLQSDLEYIANQQKLSELQASAPERPVVDNGLLKEKKISIAAEIDSLKSDLQVENLIKQTDARIAELEAQEKKLAQEIADVDKQIFTLEEFTKLKIDEIERRVRDKFSLVSFRMFRTLVNGGVEPCCDILIDGVPFSDANTASKINGGLSIINTLSKHFGVSAPVFLDNRESVSDVIETDAQLINLIVSPAHKELTVEVAEKELVNI